MERLNYTEIAPENQIDVALALNSPRCHMGGIIIEDAEKNLQSNYPDCEVNINLVGDSAWFIEKLTEDGKEQLEFY